jgi:hypothetical protein
VEEENLNLKTVEELNIKLWNCIADLEAVYNPNEVSQYTIESTPTILRKNS